MNICCADPFYTRRVKTTYSSLADLKSCKAFKESNRKWGKFGKVCNMHKERDLSLVRKATPSHLPYAERVCAAGLVASLMRAHRSEGGADPRITTRQNLTDIGMPLECNKPVSNKGGLHPSMLFANDRLADVKKKRVRDEEPPLTKPECVELSGRFNQDFHTIPEEQQAEYVRLARTKKEEKRSAVAHTAGGASSYNSARRWGLCNRSEPVDIEHLIETFTENAASGSVGGLFNTCSLLRDKFRKDLVVHDAGVASWVAFWHIFVSLVKPLAVSPAAYS